MKTRLIEKPSDLIQTCELIATQPWIALDTEFMRETTYYPKLCLIQIATPEYSACIDPIVLDDISPILDIIFDPDITKVVHAGSQDLEIFFHLRNEVPGPIFDTQIAAPLLGYPEQAGYARLVESILGVHLDKAHTRTDWSKRPLSNAQIKYATEDVVHLCSLYQSIHSELDKKNRLEWLQDDFIKLLDPDRYRNPPDMAWTRLKGANRLKGKSLRIAQDLAAWREATAQTENRPRGRLLKDDAIIDIARQKPRDSNSLKDIRSLHPGSVKRYGPAIQDAVMNSSDKQPETLPVTSRKRPPTRDEEAVASLLNALIITRAKKLELNPTVVAPQKEILRLLRGDRSSALLAGWRFELVGKELQDALNGKYAFTIDSGKIRAEYV